ncbi:MAG: hypothetical protein ACLUNO_10615 [Oscillospiraceae bacterium]
MSDFIGYAKAKRIPVGPGRGSAAGSVVSYCARHHGRGPRCGITLYFERFLNPERVSMPDIDVDFCVQRRGEVIDYVIRKYGADHVAQIVTFGTMAARAAIRDVGRVAEPDLRRDGRRGQQVPIGPGAHQHHARRGAASSRKPLRAMYDERRAGCTSLIDTARAIEGMPRHASTHAAGVVITRAAGVRLCAAGHATTATLVVPVYR